MRIAERKESPIIGLTGMGGGLASYILYGSAASGGYEISRSLRFDASEPSYLSGDFSSVTFTDYNVGTIACWVKRSHTGYGVLVAGWDGGVSYSGSIQFNNTDDTLQVSVGGSAAHTFKTNKPFKDLSAWYHVVAVWDRSASAADKIKVWVNGVAQTSSDTGYQAWTSGDSQILRNNSSNRIGRGDGDRYNNYFGGYLADYHFVDGQALDETYFGEFNTDGVWDPKEYTGTHGNAGFHLKFDDNSSASALGTDSSGNTNNWTTSGIGVAPGVSAARSNFDCITYTGNGSSQNITGLDFQPDLVVVKSRGGDAPPWVDSVRGANNTLFSSNTSSSGSYSSITGFLSNGFSVGSYNNANQGSVNFIAWCWKAGGAASANTDGTISSQVSANPSYGFSVVTWTADTQSPATVGHGLGKAPTFVITKSTSSGNNWAIWHNDLANKSTLLRFTDGTPITSTDYWQTDSDWTDTTFGVYGTANTGDNNYGDMVAYCFTDITGYQKIGSYTGNGSNTGPTVTTGFKPRFLLIKNITDASNHWVTYDSERVTTNPRGRITWSDGAAETSASTIDLDFLDDGFQPKATGSTINKSNSTYLYLAIGDAPLSFDNDSVIDTPSSYTADSGNNGGNYCTLNPLVTTGGSSSTSSATISNGSLTSTNPASNAWNVEVGTIPLNSGKWYYEYSVSGTLTNFLGGWADPHEVNMADAVGNTSRSYGYYSTGNVRNSNSNTSFGDTYVAGDVIGCAIDIDNLKIYWSKNGVWQNSADPAAGTNSIYTIQDPVANNFFYTIAVSTYDSSQSVSVNTGSQPFKYTPPTGFLSICTQNLPDPTVADGSTAFDAKLWTGDGSSSRAITGYNMSPDFVWIKIRNDAYGHALFDAVRGPNIRLNTVGTGADQTVTDGLHSFDSNGFTIGNRNTVGELNKTYVGWAWDAGSNSNKTYTVKVVSDSGNKYRFDDFGTSAVTLELEEGSTYVFDSSDSSVDSHPFVLGTSANSNEYSTGVTYTLDGTDVTYSAYTSGFAAATTRKLTITVPASAPTLYYWCSVHSGMGGQVNTNSTAGSSNFDGSIQSVVRANQTTGFSIITLDFPTYSGTSSVGHGLNAAPHWWIMKDRDSSDGWYVGHISLGAGKYVRLESSDAEGSSTTLWDNTLPSSSVIYNNGTSMTGSGSYVMYAWAPVSGYSAFGLFAGNSTNPGPFQYCGFRPKWIILKGVSANSRDWIILDAERDPINTAEKYLYPNSTGVEQAYDVVDFLSNGFQMRYAGGLANQTGENYIWAAFAEHPFKNVRAR